MTESCAIRSAVASLALAMAACTVTTSGAQCKTDDNCQTGQYCAAQGGQEGTCQACNCGGGLVCTLGANQEAACSCPSNTTATFYADANAGSLVNSPAPPTGVQSPAQCRFKSLADALAAASTTAPGAVVSATGWSPGTSPMTFSPVGPLTVTAGVTLTSDDPTGKNYVIVAPSMTMPFITVGAGATLSGFGIQNQSATGNAIQSDCSAGGGTVTVKAVNVTGKGVGTPAPEFQTGLYHSGNCALDLEESSIAGASQAGVSVTTLANVILLNNVVSGATPGVSLAAEGSITLVDNLISGNHAVAIPTISRSCGGVLLEAAAAPASVLAHGNQIYGNDGDQVVVYLTTDASGTVDLSGGTGTSACGTTSNFFACYGALYGGGVGVFSNAANTDLSYNQWTVSKPSFGTDYLSTPAVTLYCPPNTTFTCPPPP